MQIPQQRRPRRRSPERGADAGLWHLVLPPPRLRPLPLLPHLHHARAEEEPPGLPPQEVPLDSAQGGRGVLRGGGPEGLLQV